MTILKSSLDRLPAAAVESLACSAGGFFHSYAWFLNFNRTVLTAMKAESGFFYQAHLPKPLVLPLLFVNEGSLRVARSLTNYYSPIFSLNLRGLPADERQTAAFFTELKSLLPDWDIMELRPLAFEESEFLLRQLKAAGLPCIRFFCFGNWYLEVKGRSFEEYFAGLPAPLRNTVSRKRKAFFKLDGARSEILTSLQDLERGIADYQTVYEASWKVEEPFPEFMPGLMRMAAEQGVLRLGIAYLGTRAIAAQVWIVADRTAYIFKLAYDEAYKHYSPGSILSAKLMAHVIDIDKVEVVDYLCGDDAYKKDWMSGRRERWGIWAFNTSTLRGRLAYLKEVAKYRLKRFLPNLGRAANNRGV